MSDFIIFYYLIILTFDFEFAGFDDPCKLIVDLILQPDFSIPSKYIYLMNKLVDVLKSDIQILKKG